MFRAKRVLVILITSILALSLMWSADITSVASNSKECLDDLNAGVALIIDPSAFLSDSSKEAIDELQEMVRNREDGPVEESNIFMADVQQAMNVRADADEESAKVGLLYKDCGGHVLERKDGWSYIESGDLVGWACDDYLLFGEEAETLAKEVGFQVAVVQADALRLRKEPSSDAKIVSLLAQGDALEVVGEEEDGWIPVEMENETAYVSAEYVKLDFQIDAGETMQAIEKRQKEEAEAKRKAALTANRGAVIADADETRLLAALIQCEAGSVNYDGMLAVGAVVMNRVRSGAYPNTIPGVIYASGQFTPALNGKVAARYNSTVCDLCIQAAQAALAGQTNVGGATHFKRAGNHDGLLIGGQVFW